MHKDLRHMGNVFRTYLNLIYIYFLVFLLHFFQSSLHGIHLVESMNSKSYKP